MSSSTIDPVAQTFIIFLERSHRRAYLFAFAYYQLSMVIQLGNL